MTVIQRSHYIKMFTDLICYSKKILYSHLVALLLLCQNVFLSQLKRIYYNLDGQRQGGPEGEDYRKPPGLVKRAITKNESGGVT